MHSAGFQRKGVADTFTRDAQFCASGLPLLSMRSDFTASAASVGDEVSEFMLEGSLGFFFGKFLEPWVHLNAAVRPERSPDGGSHTLVPGDADFFGEFCQVEGFRGFATPCCHFFITWEFFGELGHGCFRRPREAELEF